MSALEYTANDGAGLVAAIRARRVSARTITEAALAQIGKRGPAVNAFTTVLAAQARADADRVDAMSAAGRDPGPLAGLPFAVKTCSTSPASPRWPARRSTPSARLLRVTRRRWRPCGGPARCWWAR